VTPLTVPTGGIARYTSELAAALAVDFPGDEYFLLSDQNVTAPPAAPNLRTGRKPGNFITRRWWLAGLPLELARLQTDLFHGTDFGVPYLPVRPSVLTLHDLSPWRPGRERSEASERIRGRTPYLLRLATMIITPSESIRREAMECFHIHPSRVVSVPLAAAAHFNPGAIHQNSGILSRLGVAERYLLFVGTADRRKNLCALISAWSAARRECADLDLVIVGWPGPAGDALPGITSELLNSGAPQGLIFTGPLPDPEVAELMAKASIFVYPSLYEGFGLPVLEAMQAGAPVVISRDAALTEVAGNAALAVDSDSAGELAGVIVQLMKDPSQRLKLRGNGLRRAAQFSWRQTAIRTHEVYVEALRRF